MRYESEHGMDFNVWAVALKRFSFKMSRSLGPIPEGIVFKYSAATTVFFRDGAH